MNFRLIFKLIGNVLRYEALLMILPLAISFYYNENDRFAFIASMGIVLCISLLLGFIKPKTTKFDIKGSFVGVALTWIFLSLFGAIPFYISGYFGGLINCIFESTAAFTTAGASTLANVEGVPRGLLFWRSFMQWIGGMGALILVLAIMPQMGASGMQLMRAESPGPSPEKFVPKIKETAKIMYLIYFVMTIVQIILLMLAGLPVYDSVIHAFGTAATGGFSNMNLSVGAYNNVFAEIVITVFMFLFGVNFSLYYQLIRKNYSVFKDEEFLVYLGVITAAIILICVNIKDVYGGFSESLRHASFQVTSVISTTCYSTSDFNLWPTFSKLILLLLMFIGGCAGSTSGGLKITRLIIMVKAARLEVKKVIQPRVVNTVKINGKRVAHDFIGKVFLYLFLYVAIIILASILISFENKDLISTFTAVLGAISTVGPGLEIVGPTGNFSTFAPFSKIILSFCMILGRLEIFPVLTLFYPAIWKKRSII